MVGTQRQQHRRNRDREYELNAVSQIQHNLGIIYLISEIHSCISAIRLCLMFYKATKFQFVRRSHFSR